MQIEDLTNPMIKVMLSAIWSGQRAPSKTWFKDGRKLGHTAWRLLEDGWQVETHGYRQDEEPAVVVSRGYITRDEIIGAPLLRRGLLFVRAHVWQNNYTTRVIGLSKKLRSQDREINASPAAVATHPERFKSALPALSVYGVPWEIAWIRSRKARWEAIRAYRRAHKETT